LTFKEQYQHLLNFDAYEKVQIRYCRLLEYS